MRVSESESERDREIEREKERKNDKLVSRLVCFER